MLDGKLVERKDVARRPDESWMVRSLATDSKSFWMFSSNPDNAEWLKRETGKLESIGVSYRVYHCTDRPKPLPDEDKLSEWLWMQARESLASSWSELDRQTQTEWTFAADAVIALIRDGVPEELMGDKPGGESE